MIDLKCRLCKLFAVQQNVHFRCSFRNNREGRFWDYTLTIYNLTFDDEVDFKVTAKSSNLEKSVLIKPQIFGRSQSEEGVEIRLKDSSR